MKTRTDDAPPLEYLSEIVLDSTRDLPLHAQLRSSLERLIHERMAGDARFYSESQLISHLKISQGTVRRALADLAGQGLLEKRPARGTVVRKQEKSTGLHHLAVFLPDYSSQNVAQFLSLLNAECMNRNMALQPIYTHRGERLLLAYTSLRFGPQEGGVVLLENSPRATVELHSALHEKGYNCVVIGTLLRNANFKFVGGCNTTSVKLALQHLVDLGHRRISLLVNEPEEKENVQERIAAFDSFVKECSTPLEPQILRSGNQLWDDSRTVENVLSNAMKPGSAPTAILAVSDVGALATIKWLQQQGFSVPRDVSVMGIDGIEMGGMIHPALTTMVNPFEDMTEVVFELLSEVGGPPRKVLVPAKLLVRESTAPPPAVA